LLINKMSVFRVFDLDRKINLECKWPKHVRCGRTVRDEVYDLLNEYNDRNIKRDAAMLSHSLWQYRLTGDAAGHMEDQHHFTVIVAMKHAYGSRYLTLRHMAIECMPSNARETFGDISSSKAKKQIKFNRGDFKKAAKSMGFNPALIKKSDETISKAIEDVGRKVIKPEQLTNRIARDLNCDPFKAKEYMDKYRSHKPVQQQPQVMNLLNFKQAAQLTKVQGGAVKKKAQDSWADESEFTGDAKKYTLANKKMAELRVPQHAKIDVKQLLLTSKLPEAQ